jgi:predicted Zn-dependent peptidase
MKKTTTNNLIANSIKREHERLAILKISIPVHAGHTKISEALRLVYSEALTSGCGKFTRDAFQDILSLNGATLSVHSEDDTIEVNVRSLDTSLPTILKLLECMVADPIFSASELVRIKKHVRNSLTLAREDARLISYQQFINALVADTDRRYQTPIETIMARVSKVSLSDLRKFHQELFKYTWTYTCAGSAGSISKINKVMRKIGTGVTSQSLVSVSLPLPPLSGRFVLLTDIPHKQNIEFSIGAQLPLYPTEREYAAFIFGMSVLALQGGFSGRLMSTVREKEGLTYMIYGKTEKGTRVEYGFWRIMTFFSPKDAVRGITSTLRELRRMHTEGITEDELRRFKAILKTRMALREDSLLKQVGELHARSEAGITETDYNNFKNAIEEMTVEEVNTVMNKYLNAEHVVVSGAGPIKGVQRDIESFRS